MILVVGITGASGVIYGIRMLEVLSAIGGMETHLIVSEAAALVIKHETNWSLKISSRSLHLHISIPIWAPAWPPVHSSTTA